LRWCQYARIDAVAGPTHARGLVASKTAQIQLRVSPAQKADLVRRARAAGLDLSAWMLRRLIPDGRLRFLALARSLALTSTAGPVLAEISDLLASLRGADFSTSVELLPPVRLDDLRANQLAAMVETRAAQLSTRPPDWVKQVKPLARPWFASELVALRLHLLCNSPPAYRRRNLFVDSTIGDRV
jgi:hypothetical protein